MARGGRSLLMQTYRYLGQDIGRIEKFLSETACLYHEQREQIALLHVFELLFPEDFEKDQELQQLFTVLKEALKKLGLAKWPRTELTDLALKKGDRWKTESLGEPEDQKKLEEQLEGLNELSLGARQ